MIRIDERRGPISRRRGLAALEVVMVTAITVPMSIAMLFLCIRACKWAFRVVGPLVGYPYL